MHDFKAHEVPWVAGFKAQGVPWVAGFKELRVPWVAGFKAHGVHTVHISNLSFSGVAGSGGTGDLSCPCFLPEFLLCCRNLKHKGSMRSMFLT